MPSRADRQDEEEARVQETWARRIVCRLSLAVAVWSAGPTASARTLETIKASGSLRICVAPLAHFVSISPRGCERQCQLAGASVDMAYRFAEFVSKHLGMRIAPENRVLPSFEDYFVNDEGRTEPHATYTPKHLKSGDCDFYAESLAKRDWRLNKVAIVTYMPGRQMVVVNQTKAGRLKTERDLGGLRTIAEKNTIYHSFVEELNAGILKGKPAKLGVAVSGEEKLLALEAGKIDFAIIDVGTALQITNPALSKYKNLRPAFPVGPTGWGGWAFRKEDKPLQELAERFFVQQIADKEQGINTIFKKYYGVTHAEYLNILTSVQGAD
jgi:ABC-type amino acid transport substrate-binding protein